MKTLDQQFNEVFKAPASDNIRVFEQYAQKRRAGMEPEQAAAALDLNPAIAEQLYVTRAIAQ